ncbi:hypothetical protein EV182_003454 [Spiromyces aspiralis]|uniref:Uncharacterized protein n=1 Tax=Spiromyces aspiralis TaxID=68401 RepID=A0ACC1HGA5_9FUNG|nr:hypothetical protein EV182_003454 [Spiromyces aspiralis]
MKDQLDAQERALSVAYCTMRVLREEVQRSVLDTASLADHVLQRMVGENRQDAHDLEQRVAGRGDDSDECDSGIAAAPGGRVEELSRMMAQVMSIEAHIKADESFFMDRLADLELTHRSEVERRQILSDLENLQLTIMNQQILDATEEMQRKHQQQVSGLREQIEAEYAEKTKQRIISEARLQKQVNELTKRIKELEEERLALGAAKEHRGETDVAEIESLREQNADLAMQLETHKTAVGVELEQYEAELERINALASMYLDKLESSEKEMAELVEEVRELQQTAYEAESEKNAMAERLKWQIDWLKSNYALAYQEMNRLMTDNSQLAGHQNLRQKIRYVERLKEENIDLRREKMTLAKARDEWRSKASQLERELEAYKAVEVVRRRVGGGSGGRAWSATAAMPRPPAAQWQRFGEKKRRLRDDLGGSKGNEDDDGVAADDAQKENNINSQNQQLSVTSKVSRLLETKPRQLLLRDDIEVDENRTTGNGR